MRDRLSSYRLQRNVGAGRGPSASCDYGFHRRPGRHPLSWRGSRRIRRRVEIHGTVADRDVGSSVVHPPSLAADTPRGPAVLGARPRDRGAVVCAKRGADRRSALSSDQRMVGAYRRALGRATTAAGRPDHWPYVDSPG